MYEHFLLHDAEDACTHESGVLIATIYQTLLTSLCRGAGLGQTLTGRPHLSVEKRLM